MLATRWCKVLNDLTGNKTRTLLIVLSIAVGLFAIGTIVSARTLLSTEMARSYAAISPSDGIVRTVELFNEDFVRAVRAMPEVADVDARRVLEVRAQVIAADSTDDHPLNSAQSTEMTLRVFAVRDYDTMRVDLIFPSPGGEESELSAWPPPEREILVERSALAVLDARVGDTLSIELPGGRVRHLRIAGLAHDMVQVPAQFDGTPYGYIAFETLTWLGEPYGFNELHVRVIPPVSPPVGRTKGGSRSAVNAVKDKAEDNGFTIPLSLTAEPGALPLDDILDAVLLLMGALGVLALLLSVFLILNTVSALLAQQKRQIGVMKAIGARTGQIMGMYLTLALLYGLCALLIAIPLSCVSARALSAFIAGMFNFDLREARLSPTAALIQIAVGMIVPVLASLPPFLANLRVTAAEALRMGYHPGKGHFGAGWIDRLLSGANLWFTRHILRRPLLLSLRNTFRSKGRLALTLITLTLGGAIFMGVFSVQASLDQTLDELLQWWGFDVMVIPARSYRADKMIQAALDVPGVAAADIWFQLPARRVHPDGVESDNLYFFVPHPDSALVPAPKMLAGRWLLPEDENAVVLNALAIKEEPDIEVGSEVVLKIMGRERTYRVVGVCMGILMPMGYAPYPYIARTTGQVGMGGAALIRTEHHDADTVAATATAVETHFERAGLRVSDTQTVSGEREEAGTSFGIIIALLMVMAVLLALVGGLGLMGAMSINVLERAREIGVLRAIGAPNRGVAQVFIVEGVTIGVLSWAFGTTLAFPLGRLLSDAVGLPLMGAPLSFSFSTLGVWIWLGVVVVLSVFASALPARNASRLTVREVLAYE
ncbi:MAG: ABC transporter permease [Anaerolineae bacterium]|nr:ABC transporter permease [Anaerolineae bacterium]